MSPTLEDGVVESIRGGVSDISSRFGALDQVDLDLFPSLTSFLVQQESSLLYGTSSAELIQHQFPAALFTVK